MSLRVMTTACISRRNADVLQDGYDFAASRGLVPNIFLTVRWEETNFKFNPFVGLQKILEKLRKLDGTRPCVFFWSREREAANASEHTHIAICLRVMGLRPLKDLICRWVGSEVEASAVDVRNCKSHEWCNAETLVKLYFLKGLPKELRSEYGLRKTGKSQGLIAGKRVGVSQYVSRGIREIRAARATGQPALAQCAVPEALHEPSPANVGWDSALAEDEAPRGVHGT